MTNLERKITLWRKLAGRREGYKVKELAEALGVSKNTIKRDIDALSTVGVPVRDEAEGQTIRSWIEAHVARRGLAPVLEVRGATPAAPLPEPLPEGGDMAMRLRRSIGGPGCTAIRRSFARTRTGKRECGRARELRPLGILQ